MQEPQKLDLEPGARDLVIQIVGGVLSVNQDTLKPSSSLGIGALVLLQVVLSQGHDKRSNGQRNAQIIVVHQVD